jgi:hypothetical protein
MVKARTFRVASTRPTQSWWKGKQLTTIGKFVITGKLPVRCVLRRKWLIFNNSISTTETGTSEANGGGRHCAQ